MRIRPVLTTLALALALAQQSASALDLAEAYQLALSNDPSWASSQHTYQADQENRALSRAYLLPSLDLNGTISHQETSSPTIPGTTFGGTHSYRQTQYGAKLTQPLFRVDAWYAYQQAKAVTSASEASFRQQQQDLVLRVANAYFGVLQAQENLEYSKAEEAALGRQLDQAQQRFDVGLIAITDVLQARAQFDASRASRISSEAALNNARETLATIVGRSDDKLVPLKAEAPMNRPLPDSPDPWVKLALQNNPQLAAARFNEDSARAAASQSGSGNYPNIDAYAQYNKVDIPDAKNNPGLALSDTTTKAYGISATWNVFGGGRTYIASKQASYKAAAAQDQVTAAERNVTSSTRTAYLNVAANSYQVDARKQAVKSSEAAVAATQAGYQVGTRNIVDVLLAESNLYAAKRDYASSRYDYVINTLKLKSASGQLSEVDIKDLNNWLDPNGSITAAPEAPADEGAASTTQPVAPAATSKPAKKK
jgi:outer membrane protein